MRLTDDEKAAIVLTTRLGGTDRRSLTPKAWHRVVESLRLAEKQPSDIFADQSDVNGDDLARVQELLSSAASAVLDLERQISKGIWVLTEFDDRYPERYRLFGDSAPPVLFGVGSSSLLSQGGVGIVGSRDVDEHGARVAQDLAMEAVRIGKPVVSGGARGVDQLAMNAAFMSNGAVVGVLADALDRRLRSSDMLHALDQESVCLITQQHPSTGFSPGAAYGRNKLVYALCDVTVIVASAEGEGGTWKGAVEAMKLDLPVAVWRGDGEGPGNAQLQSMGARPISRITELEELTAEIIEVPRPEQLPIF